MQFLRRILRTKKGLQQPSFFLHHGKRPDAPLSNDAPGLDQQRR